MKAERENRGAHSIPSRAHDMHLPPVRSLETPSKPFSFDELRTAAEPDLSKDRPERIDLSNSDLPTVVHDRKGKLTTRDVVAVSEMLEQKFKLAGVKVDSEQDVPTVIVPKNKRIDEDFLEEIKESLDQFPGYVVSSVQRAQAAAMWELSVKFQNGSELSLVLDQEFGNRNFDSLRVIYFPEGRTRPRKEVLKILSE